MQDEFPIQYLDGFGLTTYEAKVYLALLKKKNLTAAEIARLANVPRSRTYDNLKLLESKGLCQVISDKVKLYSAVNPSRFKDIFIKSEKDRLDAKKEKFDQEIQNEKNKLVEKIKNIESLAEEYESGRKNDSAIDYIEVIKDSEYIHNKVCDLFNNAKKEILLFTKPPFITPNREEQVDANITALKKDIVIKNIYEIPQNKEEIKALIKEIEYSQRDGELSKVAEFLPSKMIIFDDETVLYSLNDPLSLNASVTTSMVKHKSLAQLLKLAFNDAWRDAQDPEVLKSMI